jgi:16S rRNA G966 N2-methylase RsmD
MAKKISGATERGSPSRSTSESSNVVSKSSRVRAGEAAAGQETRAPKAARDSLARRTGEGRGEGRPSSLLDTRVVYCGDNLEQLAKLPGACVDLIYIDPPFNSNRNYEVFWGET